MSRDPRRTLAIAAAIIILETLVPIDRAPAQSINQGKTKVDAIIVGSDKLYDGVFSATGISSLNVHVRTPDGGKPHAYVLNTVPPAPRTSGEATLARKGIG